MKLISLNLHNLIHTHAQLDFTPKKGAYNALKAQIEPAFFYHLLEYTQGNKSRAAKIAGIDIGTLSRKLKYYCIQINKHIVTQVAQGDV
jgi:DNA-binding protein Fis